MRRWQWGVAAALLVWSLGLMAAAAAPQEDFDCTRVDVPVAECEALVTLYNETDGPHWLRQQDWLQSRQLCSWEGITCTAATRVFILDISTNLLTGYIPPELANLSEMVVLVLSYNELHGTIPEELASLGKLQGLYLHRNQLTGSIPPALGNIPHLSQLYLNGNQLNGGVPATLGNATLLRDLVLNDNALEGPLPVTLKNLNQMQKFHYHNTNLCEPNDAAFTAWLNAIADRQGTGEACPAPVVTRALWVPLLLR